MKNYKKLIIYGIGLIFVLIFFSIINPFSYNDPTERTVITTQGGEQKVIFEPGIFYAGLFAHEQSYPNQIGVQYKADKEDLDLIDNTIDIGKTAIQFLGGATATVTGIVQFNLPGMKAAKDLTLDLKNK